MEIKRRSPLLLFLLFLFLSSGLLHCFAQSWNEAEEFENDSWEEDDQDEFIMSNQQDPARRQYQECQRRCQRQQKGQSQQQCQRACEQQFERRRQQVRQCQQQCQGRRSPQERQQCQQRCQQRQQQQQRQESRLGGRENQRRTSSNPYYFDSQSFTYRFQSPAGHLKVLPRFTDVRPQLFEAIRNYRLAVLVAHPHTFVQPHYCDAASLLVVLQGRTTISLVCQEGRQSFNLERGQVIRVPAGVLVYLSNPDSNQELHIAKLLQPVFTPGHFEEYFITENAKSQVSALSGFSEEVLESSQKTPAQEIRRILGGETQTQRRPIIQRVSPEHLKELSQQASTSPKQETKEIIRPFNLLQEQPIYSNNWGQFFEARPTKHKQLQDLDVGVAIARMKQGSVFVPHYNSKATIIVFVTRGRVRFEMICPHVSMERQGRRGYSEGEEEEYRQGRRGYSEEEEEEEREERQGKMHRIVAEASAGDAFLIPAGHAVALIAHEDTETLGFELRSENNERNFLAGQNNIINKMEDAAKALTFGPQHVETVKRVFRSNPSESVFVGRQRQGEQGQQGRQQEEEGRHRLSSILDLTE